VNPILVDHILVETFRHQLFSFGFHPGGNESRQILSGIAIQNQFVMDQVVDDSRRGTVLWETVPGNGFGHFPGGIGGSQQGV